MAEYIKPENDRYIKLSQALEVLDSCACWWAHDQMELIPAADVLPRDEAVKMGAAERGISMEENIFAAVTLLIGFFFGFLAGRSSA